MEIVSGLLMVTPPDNWRAAPTAAPKPIAPDPSALELDTFSAPALIVTVPAKLWLPLISKVPLSCLVKPAALMIEFVPVRFSVWLAMTSMMLLAAVALAKLMERPLLMPPVPMARSAVVVPLMVIVLAVLPSGCSCPSCRCHC